MAESGGAEAAVGPDAKKEDQAGDEKVSKHLLPKLNLTQTEDPTKRIEVEVAEEDSDTDLTLSVTNRSCISEQNTPRNADISNHGDTMRQRARTNSLFGRPRRDSAQSRRDSTLSLDTAPTPIPPPQSTIAPSQLLQATKPEVGPFTDSPAPSPAPSSSPTVEPLAPLDPESTTLEAPTPTPDDPNPEDHTLDTPIPDNQTPENPIPETHTLDPTPNPIPEHIPEHTPEKHASDHTPDLIPEDTLEKNNPDPTPDLTPEKHTPEQLASKHPDTASESSSHHDIEYQEASPEHSLDRHGRVPSPETPARATLTVSTTNDLDSVLDPELDPSPIRPIHSEPGSPSAIDFDPMLDSNPMCADSSIPCLSTAPESFHTTIDSTLSTQEPSVISQPTTSSSGALSRSTNHASSSGVSARKSSLQHHPPAGEDNREWNENVESKSSIRFAHHNKSSIALKADLALANGRIKELERIQSSLKATIAKYEAHAGPIPLDGEYPEPRTLPQLQHAIHSIRGEHSMLRTDVADMLANSFLDLQASCFDIAACWSYYITTTSEMLVEKRSQSQSKSNPRPKPTAAQKPQLQAPHTQANAPVRNPTPAQPRTSAQIETQPSFANSPPESTQAVPAAPDSIHTIPSKPLPDHVLSSLGPANVTTSSRKSKPMRAKVIIRTQPPGGESVDHPVHVPNPKTIHFTKAQERHIFNFDQVYGPEASNEIIIPEMLDLSEKVLAGKNVCMVAYGETGSGKTHLMQGRDRDDGMISQIITHLISMTQENTSTLNFRLSISALEVHGDRVRDLLGVANPNEVQWNPITNPIKVGRLDITSYNDWLRLRNIIFALRHTRSASSFLSSRLSFVVTATIEILQVPSKSNPSNSILSADFKSTDPKSMPTRTTSMLTFIEMPASDLPMAPKEKGDRDLTRQLQHIRQSMFSFGDLMSCIHQISPHLPVRNSKLTSLLQTSLTTDTLMVMVVCIRNSKQSAINSLKSLTYASRIKQTPYTIMCDEHLLQQAHAQRVNLDQSSPPHPPSPFSPNETLPVPQTWLNCSRNLDPNLTY